MLSKQKCGGVVPVAASGNVKRANSLRATRSIRPWIENKSRTAFSFLRNAQVIAFVFFSLTTINAWSVEFTQAKFEAYVGDAGTDGIDDIYLKRRPDIVVVAAPTTFPVAIPKTGSYLLTGNADGTFNAPALDDNVDLSGLTKISDLSSGDFDGDGVSDLAFVIDGDTSLIALGWVEGEPARIPGLLSSIDQIESVEQPVPASLSGGMPYNELVSPKGEARILIPIQLPPGVNNLRPDLSLTYNSIPQVPYSNTNALLAGGWTLSGLPSIARCRLGVAGSANVDLSSSDQLCLDGERLIAVSGGYWSDTAEYRLENNNYTKVLAKGIGLANRYFEVYSPNGQSMVIGDSEHSTVKVSGTIYTWGVSSVTDDYGNSLSVSYEEDLTHKTNYPVEISYDGVVVDLDYRYRITRVDADVGTETISRSVALNRVTILVNGNKTRDYRVSFSEFVHDPGLPVTGPFYDYLPTEIQHCGFTSSGAAYACQEPIELSWEKTVVGIGPTYRISDLEDGRGALVEFDYENVAGFPQTPASAVDLRDDPNCPATFCDYHVSGPTESTLGHSALTGRWVVSERRRSDGLGGLRRTTFQYDGPVLMDMTNRGFAGFPATAVTQHDVPAYVSGTMQNTDITTYRKHRLDLPNRGAIAARQVVSSEAGLTSKEEFGFGYSTYPSFSSIKRSTLESHVKWVYVNGGLASAQHEQVTNCFKVKIGSSCGLVQVEYPTYVEMTTTVGTGLTNPSFSPSTWGDVPVRSITGALQTVTNRVDFENDTGNWIIGFTSERETTFSKTGHTSVSRGSSISRDGTHAKIKSITMFPGDANLEYKTTYAFNGDGNPTSLELSGAGFVTATTTMGSYLNKRYQQTVTDAEGEAYAFTYDERFGLPSTSEDPEGLTTTRLYDEIGRVISTSRPDGSVQISEYDDCAVDCTHITWADAAERITTTETHMSVQLSPTERIYPDSLGREVLRETEAFDSSNGWISTQTRYDHAGRVTKVSEPYHSVGGTVYFDTFDYEAHGRSARESQADGGYVTHSYSATGGETTITSVRRVVTSTAPVGQQEEDQTRVSKFNALGQLITSEEAVGCTRTTSLATSTQSQLKVNRWRIWTTTPPETVLNLWAPTSELLPTNLMVPAA